MVVAAAAAAPSKPTKTFPKKYDAAVHGIKDTPSAPHHAPDKDLLMPILSPFDVLIPPMLPEIAPVPEESSYTDFVPAVGEGGLVPPPEDTYSSMAGERHYALVPPPAVPAPEDPSSYLSFETPSEQPSSYARTPSDASGTEVLASLAAMIQALPHISSYSNYQPASPEARALDNGPALHLLPPPSSSSSYAKVPAPQAPHTPAREASVPLPATGLSPPQ